ncbi:MAG: hypothetical protein ABI233_04905 [Chthoniobacterales bacterium]
MREEVARLLAEAHDLLQVVKPNLFAIYQTKLGAWELKRLHLQSHIARLKRKMTLIQAAINRGAAVHEKELEDQLDLELADWRTRVAETVAAFDQAKDRLDQPMAADKARELRNLYRRLVKRLHPDLHPNLTGSERQLWHRTQSAYDRADLEELRALALVQPDSALSSMKNSIEGLQEKRDALKVHVTRLLSEMERITSEPPFTLRKQLDNAEWIEEMRKTIDGECAQLEVERAELETHVRKIMTALGRDGNGTGRN